MNTVDILDRLISFDTVSARSNLVLIAWVEAFLVERGAEVIRIPDPADDKAGLVARIGPGEAGGVMLSAHTDVVPVEGQEWTRDPFRMTEDAGRLYGRGTTDMKGFLAAMLSAADKASGMDMAAPLTLSISYDEEVGCVGIARMIQANAGAFGAPRACVVGEPTGMIPAIGHKGKVAWRATFRGQAGHSALAPRFVNALHLAANFVLGLRRMQDDLAADGAHDPDHDVPHSTLHIGKLSGGRALNIVPDVAEALFELRYLPADDPADIRARIDTMAAQVAAAHPPGRVEIAEFNAYPGLSVTPDAEVVRLVQGFAGTEMVTKVGYGTEAGYFQRLGFPVVVCGPGSMEGQGHKPDEFITRDQLARCDAMLDRMLEFLRRS